MLCWYYLEYFILEVLTYSCSAITRLYYYEYDCKTSFFLNLRFYCEKILKYLFFKVLSITSYNIFYIADTICFSRQKNCLFFEATTN